MKYEVGIIAGNFDVIHPGYIHMFRECSEMCKRFVVLLHTDPSIERPKEKIKPSNCTIFIVLTHNFNHNISNRPKNTG